ncbi:hypothetical protein [Pseudooceanicola sp. 200-1SW]|uniref:hypothetical protein n=1 Tax=Pseudooceanicola sp. 200-1SW TaxID=3425949 RepID=UPI003D7F58A5
MRLICLLCALAWLAAGLAPLHAAGMAVAGHHAFCCPEEAGAAHENSHGGDGPELPGGSVCDHASLCLGLVLPPQPPGPLSDLRPASLHWPDGGRIPERMPQAADPPPPRP